MNNKTSMNGIDIPSSGGLFYLLQLFLMKYYYCPKCTVRFGIDKQQCPNCGNYSINCEEVEEVNKPDFNFAYIREVCPDEDIFKKALIGYHSGFVPKIELKTYESRPEQDFDIQVHSFTKSKFYRVYGTFDEEGELSSCQCNCEDFNHRHHFCKHIIATLMMVYIEYCEVKYGKVDLLKKPKATKTNDSVSKTQTSTPIHKPIQIDKTPRWKIVFTIISSILILIAIILVIVLCANSTK